MTVLKIITPKDPVLRQKARRVRNVDNAKLQRLIDDMIETMLDAPGVGLAAPQVAVSKRVIVVRLPDDEESREEYGDQAGVLYVVINPEIVSHAPETMEGIEACLSIPGYFGKVDRSIAVTIEGLDRHGNPLHIEANDWLARVFQHEIDHLDGVLFTDHANEVWRARSEMPAGPDPLEGLDVKVVAPPTYSDGDID